jgi:hypothetical protein
MIVVISIMMVMTALAVVMVANLTSTQDGVRRQRNITTALAAADEAVDRVVFTIQQSSGGVQNWADFVTKYNSATGTWMGDADGWSTAGRGRYRVHVDCDRFDCSSPESSPDIRILTVEAEYPAGSGHTRTVQAELRRQGPVALDFAMFADKGLDIHHHGSSWISPMVVTPRIHSNAYINLDHSSSFQVELMSAATAVTLSKGGGSTPGGSIPTTGYTWSYWISGADPTNPKRCFPSKKFPPKDFSAETWNFPDAANNCPGTTRFSGNARVLGNIAANTVTLTARGSTSATPTVAGPCTGVIDPITGACIPSRPGDIDAGAVTMPGKTWSGPTTSTNAVTVHQRTPCTGAGCVADCPGCEQGTADAGGRVGGKVNIHKRSYTPGSLPFPSLDYDAVYLPLARADQGTPSSNVCTDQKRCHVFASESALYDYVADASKVVNAGNGVSYAATPVPPSCNGGKCVSWLDKDKKYTSTKANVAYVVMRGHYFITSGGLNLSWSTIKGKFGGTGAPVLAIAGSLVTPKGSMTLKSSINVVGPTMDPTDPFKSGIPDNTTPGFLGAGGSINASDYDDDSKWDTVPAYQGGVRNAVAVRGLVYSAAWDANAKRSSSADQHWHNYDPKNSVAIIGAQVGGKLHDCNSFLFAYDPLIKNLPGFTSGGTSVWVVSWREV